MEDFRIRAQRFFSDTRVVISVSVFLFVALMLFFNFAGTLAVNGWEYLRACMKAGAMKSHKIAFLMPSPFLFSWRLRWMYLICGIMSAIFAARVGYLMITNLSPLSNAKVKGSRHFATVVELENEYRSVPEKIDRFDGPGGFPIARYKDRIFIDDSAVNNLIIGTTRSGKGEIYVIPAIDIYSRSDNPRDRASMILADPKGELAGASKGELERRGYQVYIFDLLTFMGMSFNPLQLVKDAYIRGDRAEAQLLSNTMSNIMFNDPLAKDKTWQNWSMALTNALILALVIDCCSAADQCESPEEKQVWYDKINMYSVARILIDLGDPNADEESNAPNKVDLYFSQRDFNDIARIQYAAVGLNPMRTKTGIYGNTLAVLTKFTMDPIARMTAQNSVNLEEIGFCQTHPTAVFLVMPDYDTSNQFLATMFITQLYYVLSKKSSISPGGQCPRQVVFILDEFGNIVPIPDMAHILTVCLGRNIRFDLVIQAYSQIFKLYGEQDGRTIIGNCGNQIYLLTIEEDTARRISSLVGNKTITVFSRSEKGNLSLDKNISEHVDTQPLLNPNELMEFKPGEGVVVRITKRTDLQGRKIKPSPIYNHDETVMKYRYEYLGEEFDPRRSFQSLKLADNCLHKDLDLSALVYTPQLEDSDKIKEVTVQQADPYLSDILSMQQMEQISRFLETASVDTSVIRWDIIMTTFDAYLQDLLDKQKIPREIFEDIFTVLDQAAAAYERERSVSVETAS